MASFEALLQFFQRSGYEVRFREDEWVECLLIRENETWLGRGLDRESALHAAKDKACPSAVAQQLLSSAITSGPTDSIIPQPRSQSKPKLRPVSGRPRLARKEDLPPPADHERSIEQLAVLSDRIQDSREELGMASPERQRLAILAWICEARAHTELFEESQRIREDVATISRQLTDIGKSFWPGSVTALQLQMQPRDLPRHLLGGAATTWTRASELAERALRSLEVSDERRGFDSYGWADLSATDPLPGVPAELLDELVQEVSEKTGLLDRSAVPREQSMRPDPEDYRRWIRTLRWLRCAHINPEDWARIAGRLRWFAGRRDARLQAAARELESSYAPPQTWADELGAPGDEDNGQRRLPEELIAKVRDQLEGKSIVFVSNKRDPDLQNSLSETISGASFEWRVADPRRLRDLGEELSEGNFDVVLAAIGFQAQDMDHLLASACKRGQVRYVRVNWGRPVACIRALARRFDASL